MLKKALRLATADNVAVALEDLEKDDEVEVRTKDGEVDTVLKVVELVPFGHKFALCCIEARSIIFKYGEKIGRSTAPIEPGKWVHTHNLISARVTGGRKDVG